MKRFGVILIVLVSWTGASGQVTHAQTKPLHRIEVGQAVHTLRFSPDGRYLATTSRSQRQGPVGKVRLFNVTTAKLHHDRAAGFDRLAFSPDAKHFVVRMPKGMGLYRTQDGKAVHQFETGRSVCDMVFNPTGDRLIAAIGEGTEHGNKIQVWNTRNAKMVSQADHLAFTSAMALSPDGQSVLLGGWNGSMSLYRWAESKRTVTKVKIKGYKICDVAFNPGGQWVASAHQSDPRLTLWDARSLDSMRELHGANGHLFSLAFSPDGRLVAAAGSQREIYLWEAKQDANAITKSTALILRGHEGRIASLDISPDGRLIATADRDGVVLVWSLRDRSWSQEELADLSDAKSDALWRRLGSDDPVEGFAAVQLLAAHPKQAVPLIQRQLKTVNTGPPESVQQWVRDLADGDFVKREHASRQLHPFISMYRAYFVEARQNAQVPETRHRLSRLLMVQAGALNLTKAMRRAIHVLEWIQSPASVALIRDIGQHRSVQQDAHEALHRLGIPVKNDANSGQ